MRTVVWLLISWAVGLAAYGGALVALRGEVLSLDNWTLVGSVTLVAWFVSSIVILPILRLLVSRRSPDRRRGGLALVGAVVAIVPLWLNLTFWYGWNPRHLLIGEAGFLGVHYATSGLVLSLLLARQAAPQAKG